MDVLFVQDTGISVRKRVIKIFRDICVEHSQFEKIPEMCVRMIRRVNDEEGIKVVFSARNSAHSDETKVFILFLILEIGERDLRDDVVHASRRQRRVATRASAHARHEHH